MHPIGLPRSIESTDPVSVHWDTVHGVTAIRIGAPVVTLAFSGERAGLYPDIEERIVIFIFNQPGDGATQGQLEVDLCGFQASFDQHWISKVAIRLVVVKLMHPIGLPGSVESTDGVGPGRQIGDDIAAIPLSGRIKAPPLDREWTGFNANPGDGIGAFGLNQA